MITFAVAMLSFAFGWLLAIAFVTNGLKSDIAALDEERREVDALKAEIDSLIADVDARMRANPLTFALGAHKRLPSVLS